MRLNASGVNCHYMPQGLSDTKTSIVLQVQLRLIQYLKKMASLLIFNATKQPTCVDIFIRQGINL
jgi:hypothetical protein